MTLSEYLRRKGIAHRDLADAIGVIPFSVYRYARGRMPNADIMRKIWKATNGSVEPNDWFPEVKAARRVKRIQQQIEKGTEEK